MVNEVLDSSFFTVRGMIKAARGTKSQPVFAAELGITQSTLSRYENGKANPSAQLIEKCMHILHTGARNSDPLYEYTVSIIEKSFSTSQDVKLRTALTYLIDHVYRLSNPTVRS